MKEIKKRVSDVGSKIYSSTATVIRICLQYAKTETISLVVLAFIGAVALALVSWFTAKVIGHAATVITGDVHPASFDYSIKGMFGYLWDTGLFWVAISLALIKCTNDAVRLANFLLTTNWGPKLRYAVESLVREQRMKLDVGRLRSAEYEEIKIRINEQPFGFDAIRQYAQILVMLATNLCHLIIFGIGLLYFNWHYAAWIFGAVLFRAVSEFYWNNQWWIHNDKEALYSRRRGVFSTLFSNVIPLFEMNFFGKCEVAHKLVKMSQGASLKRKSVLVKKDFWWAAITETITWVVLVAVVMHAVVSALMARNITLLVLTLDFSGRFIMSLKSILFDLSSAWRAVRSVSAITDEFFGLKPLIEQKGGRVPEGIEAIHLRDVHFSYPQAKDGAVALKGINLTIPIGAKVALVGKSGGGKSTLASLLARQYDPDKGGIFLDETPLTSVHPAAWFAHALCMGQDYAIPHVSVKEAVTYGLWEAGDESKASEKQYGLYLGTEEVDMERIERACRRANVLDVILAKPDGWNSLIGVEQGKDGTDFSKGEKQRLALAARICAERALMIYDEPDAALDALSKQKVIEGILDTDSTVILVVHNLLACKQCDLVAYIEDGIVAEQGTHEELLELNGKYAKMYRAAYDEDMRQSTPEEKREEELALAAA